MADSPAVDVRTAQDTVLVSPVPFHAFWGLPNHLLAFVGSAAAVAMAWRVGMTPELHAVTIALALLTGLGITLGFHRLFVHHSFETYRPVAWLLAVLGCMAGQTAFFLWVAEHRKHHRTADHEGDPHSPVLGGFWHAHAGWLLRKLPYDPTEVPDLLKRRDLVWIHRQSFWWYVLGLILPAIVCGAASRSWLGALMGFLWGGLFRQCFVQHATYLVNSASHLWGSQPHGSRDGSRNNGLVALLSLGEGWHNNHHAFPYSARHGLRWWQFDVTWYVIWTMQQVGLAWNVRLPPRSRGET